VVVVGRLAWFHSWYCGPRHLIELLVQPYKIICYSATVYSTDPDNNAASVGALNRTAVKKANIKVWQTRL
jgi:hypothetical protein